MQRFSMTFALDGHLDLAFANFTHNYRSDQQSLIYWGSDAGPSPSNHTELPTFLASGVAVGDLNGDGLPEVILSNRGDERGETRIGRLQYLCAAQLERIDDRLNGGLSLMP